MRRCSRCGNNNPEGLEICEDCGARLRSDNIAHGAEQVEGVSSRTAPLPATIAQAKRQPSPQSEIDTSPGRSKGSTRPIKAPDRPAIKGPKAKAHAKLVILKGSSIGSEFPLVGPESTIGRWDADSGVFPDVDLDRFDPESKISRRHARIVVDDGEYTVEDLGSTNGTFINRGRRLLPGSTHPLKHGDELIIGKTFLKFLIES